MKKNFNYTPEELQTNKVLHHLQNESRKIDFRSDALCQSIADSEALLAELGYGDDVAKARVESQNQRVEIAIQKIALPSWGELYDESNSSNKGECCITELFTQEELNSNERYINQLNEEYNVIHRLDKWDYTISGAAAIMGGILDICLIGIPKPTVDGVSAGKLSDWVRTRFNERFTPEKIKEFERKAKVSYDAQDNRNTHIRVEGLSTYYHRLLALGHDPLLGFIVGVFDIMSGRMTTIDKNGAFVSQVMENYAGRKESNLFAAIAKQFMHLKSDVGTSMGLPAPLMGLFNMMQFGSIGEEDQTIAEIVQGMYYEGYDFIHFCAMSIPMMVTEVIVRLAYFFKRRHDGCAIKEAIPFSTNHTKNPKLGTMLFIAHSGAVAINAGKVAFTKNPVSVNWAQWMAFAKYSYSQLKWGLIQKPTLRDKFVMSNLEQSRIEILQSVDREFYEFMGSRTIVLS